MQITQNDIDLFNSGDWFNLDIDILDYLLECKIKEVKKCFECRSFKAENKDGKYIIFHPCTKFDGYQLSFFDNKGAYMDIARKSIDEIVDEFLLYHDAYKIIEVIA